VSALLDALPNFNMSSSPEADAWWKELSSISFQVNIDNIPLNALSALRNLWNRPTVKEAARRRYEIRTNEHALYFLESIPRITAQGYCPTDDDIVRYQPPKMNGIVETRFSVGELNYRMLDARMRKGDKGKWWPCYEGIIGIIFCVSLAEYDQPVPGVGGMVSKAGSPPCWPVLTQAICYFRIE
jgi:hypothetical protein